MSRIFIVEDSSTQAQLIRFKLEAAGYEVDHAFNGREALANMERVNPDVVLTDLNMPEMDGLQLVEQLRSRFATVPVILMTAFGSDETAMQALKKGAASYVPKRNLNEDLLPTLDGILNTAHAAQQQQRLLECLTETESQFVLDNDCSLVAPLLGHLRQNLERMKLCDGTGLLRVTVALGEALNNAILHGNLEVSSTLRDQQDGKGFQDLADERRKQRPYRDRRVQVTAKESLSQAVYRIRDGGSGFDPSILPDPTDPSTLERSSGRGLTLIRTFMDEVYHNQQGNEITMIKRRDR